MSDLEKASSEEILEGKAAGQISAYPVVSKTWWNFLVKQLRVGGPLAKISVGAKAFGFEALE